MAPNCSATVSSTSFDDAVSEVKKTTLQSTSADIQQSEADQKYQDELKKFEDQKAELKLEILQVDDIVAKKFPHLAAARAVKNEDRYFWVRYDDEERMRVRIGLKMMRRKARDMTFDALCLEKDLLADIDRRICLTMARIAALEVNRKLQSRKRAAEASVDEKDDAKRPRLE